MKKIYPVVVAAIMDDQNRFLLTKRKSPKNEWNKWQFPGGELEFGELIEEALKREIKEELGVEIEVEKFIPKIFEIRRKEDNFHGLFFVYLSHLKNPISQIVLDDEASEYGWFSIDQIKELDGLVGLKEITEEIKDFLFNTKLIDKK